MTPTTPNGVAPNEKATFLGYNQARCVCAISLQSQHNHAAQDEKPPYQAHRQLQNQTFVRAVHIVSGCYLLIDHDLWLALGGFDPRFFMYAEEADLCLRAATLGASPAVTPVSTIIHLGGASEPSLIEKVIKIHRGRVTLIRKHWSPLKCRAGLALYWIWALFRLIGSRITSGPRDLPGQARNKWQTIRARRHEWLAGY